MKKFHTLFILLFALVWVNQSELKAQPCGVTASIVIYGGTGTVTYAADTSTLLSGWQTYAFEWEINNSISDTTWSIQNLLPSGMNLVCLRVYALNSSTGDSCMSEYCNVFQSTGNAIYPYFDVVTNNNQVTFNGGYLGGPPFFNGNIKYDFGDGVISTGSFSATHTYAASGDYTVNFYLDMAIWPGGGTASGMVSRTIHVNNGFANLELNAANNSAVCNTVTINQTSNPPFINADAHANIPIGFNSIVHGTNTNIQMADVPGHDYLMISSYDGFGGEDVNPELVFLEPCNIIPDTVIGTVFNDLNYNGLYEAGEPGIPGKIIEVTGTLYSNVYASETARYYATTDSLGNYRVLVPHDAMSIYLTNPGGLTRTFPGASNYLVDFSSGTGHTGFNWGLSALSTQICGVTYLDDNQDSLFTNGADRRFGNVNINFRNTITGLEYHTWTKADGTYCISLPPGNFVVKAVNYLLDSAAVTPDSVVINSSGGTFSNNNFGFTSPVTGNFDLTLHSNIEARPGFDFKLWDRVYNTGYTGQQGTIVLNYDSALNYVSHTPTNGIVNTGNHTITWTTDSIQPGQLRNFEGNFNIPVSTPLGTVLTNSSSITVLPGFTDVDVANNSSTLQKTVIGSFDPNDKHVSPAGVGAAGNTLHDTRLDYRIRFQNTGTASAINVIVTDTIDEDLDLNTLLIHNVSHNYVLVTNERILIWKFFNINLPDSNANEPLSHGFIEYSIAPVAGLADDTEIENSANIYFDFNPPVITNTTLNTMQTVLVSLEEDPSDLGAAIFPVPVSNVVSILPQSEIEGHLHLELFDVTGKKVMTLYNRHYIPGTKITSDLSGLSKGLYLIRITQNEKTGSSRLIKD